MIAAKEGFSKDINAVAQLIFRASELGVAEGQCEELTQWLKEILPHYLNKRKLGRA